ncbi:MAG: two-component system response regulator [Pseudonocardiales bacterium]|nr:two-component system response regulator [Pseudonocardiales bacterium]
MEDAPYDVRVMPVFDPPRAPAKTHRPYDGSRVGRNDDAVPRRNDVALRATDSTPTSLRRGWVRHLAGDAIEERWHICLVSCRQAPDKELGAADSAPRSLAAVEFVRVLVVDDDARVRAAIRETIALEPDMRVVGESSSAVEAFALAKDIEPSVALVDVLLPDMATGLALVHDLSEIPGCSVVAMSVRSTVRLEALAAGAAYFIEKGYDIDALLHTVRTAARPSTPP